MVVALGTLQALAEEDLRNILKLLLAVLDSTIQDDRRVLSDFSGGRDELPDECVVWKIVM